MLVLADERLQRLDGSGEDRLDLHRLLRQLDRASRDARDVEQIVDEPREMHGLAIDDVARPAQLGVVDRQARHDLDGVANRRERIAQLVREDREELVLVPVGLDQCSLGAGTLGDFRLQRPVRIGEFGVRALEVARSLGL